MATPEKRGRFAKPRSAVHGNLAAMQFHKFFCQGQAYAAPFVLAHKRIIHLIKTIKDFVQTIRWNADSGIRYGYHDPIVVGITANDTFSLGIQFEATSRLAPRRRRAADPALAAQPFSIDRQLAVVGAVH